MIEIRDATVEDIPELAHVHVKADWDTYAPLFGAEAYMLDVTESERRWRQAIRNGDVLLLAMHGSTIVGFGHCYEDLIGALYLLTPYHRQGIGSALLQKLLRALYGRGISTVRFDVVAKNVQAIAFYTAHGASPVGRCLNRDLRGDTEDIILVIATVPPETTVTTRT